MEPYYDCEGRIVVYHGNMLEVLPELGLRFRHCITDPPYGVQRNNNFDTMGRTGCTFGEWDEKDDVISKLPKWIECMCKYTDENMVIFNDWHNMGLISTELNKNGFEDKDMVLWKKKNPMPRNTDRRFVPCLEYALWSVRNNVKWTFNKEMGLPYEIPVIECNIEKKDESNTHTTSKPLQLMSKLVALFTNKDDLILDPFGGSGTIAVSCAKLERRIVLIEKDEKYCDVIAKRVEEETRQYKLF